MNLPTSTSERSRGQCRTDSGTYRLCQSDAGRHLANTRNPKHGHSTFLVEDNIIRSRVCQGAKCCRFKKYFGDIRSLGRHHDLQQVTFDLFLKKVQHAKTRGSSSTSREFNIKSGMMILSLGFSIISKIDNTVIDR